MTKTQDRQVYLDVAKGMGMLGVVAIVWWRPA